MGIGEMARLESGQLGLGPINYDLVMALGCMRSNPGKLIRSGYPKVVKRTFVTVADG